MEEVEENSDRREEVVYEKKEITISNLNKVFVEGNTIYYFEDQDGKKYRMDFTTKYEEQLAFLKNGDTVSIEYLESEGVQLVHSFE